MPLGSCSVAAGTLLPADGYFFFADPVAAAAGAADGVANSVANSLLLGASTGANARVSVREQRSADPACFAIPRTGEDVGG